MPMGGGGGGEVPFGVEASMMLRHSAAAANSKLCHWSDLDLCLVLALDSNALLLASLTHPHMQGALHSRQISRAMKRAFSNTLWVY